jgi:hypothetical protein
VTDVVSFGEPLQGLYPFADARDDPSVPRNRPCAGGGASDAITPIDVTPANGSGEAPEGAVAAGT